MANVGLQEQRHTDGYCFPGFLDRQRDNRADDAAVNLRAKRNGTMTKSNRTGESVSVKRAVLQVHPVGYSEPTLTTHLCRFSAFTADSQPSARLKREVLGNVALAFLQFKASSASPSLTFQSEDLHLRHNVLL